MYNSGIRFDRSVLAILAALKVFIGCEAPTNHLRDAVLPPNPVNGPTETRFLQITQSSPDKMQGVLL
jgi:hypothetical protein